MNLHRKSHGSGASGLRIGFTLLELLVTLSVIAILATAAIGTFNSGRHGTAVQHGTSLMQDMVRAARTYAIVNGTSARLIVNFDPNDEERFLRYVGIIIRDDDTGDKWKALDRGVYLPKGAYFVPRDDGSVDFDDSWPEMADASDLRSVYRVTNATASGPAICQIEYPSNSPKASHMVSEPGSNRWIVYQFSPSGRVEHVANESSSSIHNSSRIVVAAGSRSAGKIFFLDSRNLEVLRFKPSGLTALIPEPHALIAKEDGDVEDEISATDGPEDDS